MQIDYSKSIILSSVLYNKKISINIFIKKIISINKNVTNINCVQNPLVLGNNKLFTENLR